jgi:hypothetical protein
MRDRLVRVVVLAGVLAGTAWTALGAEEKGPTAGPAWVRVTAPSTSDRRLSGEIVSIDATTLILRRAGQAAPERIPLGSITSIERRLRPGRKIRGLVIGLLAGVAAGAAIGYAGGDDCNAGDLVCFDRGTTSAMGATGLGLVGLAVGALVAPGEKWEATTTERLRVDIGPAPAGGVGARLTVRF